MRKHNLRAFACALLAVIFAVSIAGCKADKTTELENRISELENENTLLRSQIDALTAQLAKDVGLYLSEWSMQPTVWDGSGGADILLTAVPSTYRDGMEADFLVYLDGQKVASAKCVWNGSSFNATVPVKAADGYSFFCNLSDSTGENASPALPPTATCSLESGTVRTGNLPCRTAMHRFSFPGLPKAVPA